MSASASGVDAVVNEGNDNLIKCLLYLPEISHSRETRPENIELTNNSVSVCIALAVALVKVAKSFAAKSRRTTKDAIGLAMATGRTRHDAS